MNREINFIGSMRYGDVFDEAIRLVATKQIDLRPLITSVLPLAAGRPSDATGRQSAAGIKSSDGDLRQIENMHLSTLIWWSARPTVGCDEIWHPSQFL